MAEHEVATSLVNTVSDKGAVDLLADLTEVAIDQMIDEDVLKDIPIVGSVLKLYNAGVGIKEYLFIRKLKKFFSQLQNVSEIDRAKFSEKVKGDERFRARVGENLLLVLERLDDMAKPQLVARAFVAFVEERITHDDFTRLSTAIDRAYLPDLTELKVHSTGYQGTDDWAQNLATCGLMSIGGTSYYGGNTDISYKTNSLGELLITVCLNEPIEGVPV